MPALKLHSETKAEALQPRVKNCSMDSSATDQPCVVNSETSDSENTVSTTKGIKMDTINETGENDDDDVQSSEEELELFVEMKYCTICHLEQPLRTKHCKSCD